MSSIFKNARRALTLAAAIAATFALAACQPVGTGSNNTGKARSGAVRVALLVPGASGQAGDDIISRSLQNAARMAIADLGGARIDLRVYETAGNPAQAGAVAVKAVDDGAEIILGPFYAQAANAAGVAVAGRGVNVLSFSNNTDIAGGNVFVLGATFQNTADRLAAYSVRQGRRKFMILNDNNPVGEIGRNAIARGVAAAGGSVAGTFGYEFSQNGIVQAAPQIAAQIRGSGADAVFMTANTAGALPLLTQMLRDNNVDPSVAQFIGLARWDIPAETQSLPGVQGGWFAMPDPAMFAQFQSRYQSSFGEVPHQTAGLAYDGIAAIGALAQRGDAISATSLTQASGFVGVAGIFRLRSDGTNERGLAVAQIRNNQVVVIENAPRSFRGAGL
tara:strand:+ start:4302 stop:5471 length:1170 start_codon:yes stop_codon:yes gene_type:complete